MKVLVVTNMYPSAMRPAYGSFVKSQVDSLERAGVETEVFYIEGYKSKIKYFLALFAMLRRSMAGGYDLVHAHYGTSGLVARAQWRAPVVVSYCGDDLYGHADEKGRPMRSSLPLVWLHKLLARFVDGVIVKSQAMTRLLPGQSVKVIPNGVDFDLFRPMDRNESRRSLGLDEGAFYILFPYDPKRIRKNFRAVEAAAQILNKDEGGRRVEVLCLQGKSNDSVPLYMNAADALVLASCWEGSPNAVKEAMACNLPVVATDVGDVRELIGGVEGCALITGTPEDIAAKLLPLVREPRRTSGRASIEHLRIERVADRVIAVYREVLAGRAGRQHSRAARPEASGQ